MTNTILTPDQIDAIGAKYRPSNGPKSMLDYTDAIVAATLAELVQRAGVEAVKHVEIVQGGGWIGLAEPRKNYYDAEAIAQLQATIEALRGEVGRLTAENASVWSLADKAKQQIEEMEAAQLEAQGEPVYAYRRKGREDFNTCDAERFIELSLKPQLFEMAVFYTHPAPAAPVVEPAQPVNQVLVDAFAKLAKRHGLTLVKTADGYDLLKLGDAQAQAQPSVEDPRENPYFQQLALEAKSSL